MLVRTAQKQRWKRLATALLPLVFLSLGLILFLSKRHYNHSTAPCVFCRIVAGELDSARMIYKDEYVAAFHDRDPASDLHALIVPVQHIPTARELTGGDLVLYEHMLAVATDVLVRYNYTADDARMGFHWPPWHSIHHMHLHVMAPWAHRKSMWYDFEFNVWMPWYVSADWVHERVRRLNTTSV